MKKKKSILFSALRTQRNSVLVRAAIELLHGGLVVAAAWETAVIVNTVFMEHGGLGETASELLMLFLCVLSMALLRLPKGRVDAQLSHHVRLSCRRAVHDAMLTHGRASSGALTLTLERVDALDPFFHTVLPTVIAGAVLVPMILIISAFADPLSALLFLVTLPIAPFLLFLIGRATRRASERQWDKMQSLTDGFGELIRAAMTLKIFRRAESEGAHLAQMSRSFAEASLSVLRLAFVSAFALELITTLSIALIAVSIGRFSNQSSYQNGVFSDGEDRLGNQAQTILISNLQQSGRFSVLDRSNMRAIKEESALNKETQNIKGARYVITGDVTEFGRKTTGDHQLFGILGKGKTQTAYAKVNLNVVDVKNSEVIYSTQGAGEYELSNREVLGFGGSAGYDSTLNGKVLSLAIIEAVNNLTRGLESGAFNAK